MDDNLKELLAQKKARLKENQKGAEILRYKDYFAKSIEQFSQKYRYADEGEARKMETFLSKLHFVRPGQLAIQDVCPYPYGKVYLWIGTASCRWFLILQSRQKIWWLSPSDKPPGKDWIWNRHWNAGCVSSRQRKNLPLREAPGMANSGWPLIVG